ncbi:MalY/PatB family protein [Bacillus weihaiensis]|uniref:MalY/PatB family protein n=1 Tax=Bacillus weihaiensis TaxID=1547283 RepID=UPI00235431F6|nr:MalY/PatB family protein [Bacillus weihaiensis]
MSRFDQLINRKNTSSVKWDYSKKLFGVDDVLPMWVADMDFKAPEEVINALHARIDHGIFGYTMPGKSMEEAIIQWVEKRHHWKVDSRWMTYSPGIVTALSLAISAYTDPTDKIVVQSPVYYPFFEMAKKHKRDVLYNELHLTEQHRYEIDFEDLEIKLSQPETTMFILCNPHNPGGRVWSKDELLQIGELCLKHHVLLISDDIHSDLLLFQHEYTPIASLREDIARNTITCIAPSKTFNLAGLQASVLLIPDESLKKKYIEAQQLYGLMTLNTLGTEAMEAAYRHGEAWLDELIVYIEENVTIVKEYLAEQLPHIRVMDPESTYLLWLDVRSFNKTDDELKKLLLHKGQLALEPGSKFGQNGAGFLRMNIACPKETLHQGLIRLVTALKDK